MVLEYLEGYNLQTVVEEDGALSIERAMSIVSQVCDALSAAHRMGIVHRDLKTSNVYLVSRGDNSDFVKVADFGISNLGYAAAPGGTLTNTRIALRSPLFMSPEQIKGRRDIDQRSDLFSLGGILYFALTGTPPFEGDTVFEVMHAVTTAEPTPLRALRPDVPDRVAVVVHKALAKDTADRYQSAAELKAALMSDRAESTRASVQGWRATASVAAQPAPQSSVGTAVRSATSQAPPARSAGVLLALVVAVAVVVALALLVQC